MSDDEGMTQPPPGCVQAPSIGSAGHVAVDSDDPIFVCVLTGDWPGSTDKIRGEAQAGMELADIIKRMIQGPGV